MACDQTAWNDLASTGDDTKCGRAALKTQIAAALHAIETAAAASPITSGIGSNNNNPVCVIAAGLVDNYGIKAALTGLQSPACDPTQTSNINAIIGILNQVPATIRGATSLKDLISKVRGLA